MVAQAAVDDVAELVGVTAAVIRIEERFDGTTLDALDRLDAVLDRQERTPVMAESAVVGLAIGDDLPDDLAHGLLARAEDPTSPRPATPWWLFAGYASHVEWMAGRVAQRRETLEAARREIIEARMGATDALGPGESCAPGSRRLGVASPRRGMSKFLDDSSHAGQPGELTLSLERLRHLRPGLLGTGTFRCGDLCTVEHPAEEMRERIAEALMLGNCSPAIVVSVEPLVVASHSMDLDAVVFLGFPAALGLAHRHGLTEGSRLLAVSTYADVRDAQDRKLFAADIVPGPRRINWSNQVPLIAEFLSDDVATIERQKAEFPPDDWTNIQAAVDVRIQELGRERVRDGRPPTSGVPVLVPGRSTRYVDITGSPGVPYWPAPTPGATSATSQPSALHEPVPWPRILVAAAIPIVFLLLQYFLRR